MAPIEARICILIPADPKQTIQGLVHRGESKFESWLTFPRNPSKFLESASLVLAWANANRPESYQVLMELPPTGRYWFDAAYGFFRSLNPNQTNFINTARFAAERDICLNQMQTQAQRLVPIRNTKPNSSALRLSYVWIQTHWPDILTQASDD